MSTNGPASAGEEVDVRRTGARIPALAGAAVVLAMAISGCGQPQYTYIAGKDRDVVLRVPRTWSPISTDAVLKANGQDPAAGDYGWLVFYDGAPKPSAGHVQVEAPDEPVMIAHSLEITEQNRDSLTTDQLRDLLEPVTEAARASDDQARASAGLAPREFKLISDQEVKTKTEQGVHVVFAYQTGSQTTYYDKISVTDPKRTRAYVMIVHCSKACFQAHQDQIADAVTSLTVKTA